mmetsp:Transcript_383/g.1019  ORF Transcript_383/g.1019 Transcript_383/m.1019 type:complete len:275 (-) Transcript_383:453-1277(-)
MVGMGGETKGTGPLVQVAKVGSQEEVGDKDRVENEEDPEEGVNVPPLLDVDDDDGQLKVVDGEEAEGEGPDDDAHVAVVDITAEVVDVTGEGEEREEGEGELDALHDVDPLGEGVERAVAGVAGAIEIAALAVVARGGHEAHRECRGDGQRASEQDLEPGLQVELPEAAHYELPRVGPRHGGALPRGEDANGPNVQRRVAKLVRNVCAGGLEPNVVLVQAAAVETLREDAHHEEVDHHRYSQSDGGLDTVVEGRLADGGAVRRVHAAALHQCRM